LVGVAPQYFNQRGTYQDTLYKIYVGMNDKYLLHRRESYIIFDVLGDLGGVLEFLVFFFGMIMLPMSEYSFNMSAFTKLYLVKSKVSPGIFNNGEDAANKRAQEADPEKGAKSSTVA